MNNEQMHQFETEQLGKAMELVRSMTQALKEEQLLRQAAEEQLAAQRNKVLFADAVPAVGMLMIPKTCAYVWTVLIGYNAMKREDRR